MIRRLRLIFPICFACLALAVFCGFAMVSRAASEDPAEGGNDAAMTYTVTVDSWSSDGVSAPLTVEELSAVQSEADEESTPTANFSYSSGEVAPQEYRDSGYELTDCERMRIECIVMCEAGGESEKGQMMVAECILDGLLRYNYTLDEYIRTYKVMSTSYSNVTDEVRNSVSRVFDNGERVIEAKADLWYNPAITASAWHEAQEYVITIGSHRFFWMIDNNA